MNTASHEEIIPAGFPESPDYIRTYTDPDGTFTVRLVSSARLPTRFGDFTIYGFHDTKGNKEHTAIVQGKVAGEHGVPLRMHSECHTGDVMGSLRCDCRDQLEAALTYISSQPKGVVLYLKQEGRGIGLLNKIKAYELQDRGFDTVDANLKLGLPAEARYYQGAAAMISLLGLQSIKLLTNNPAKLEGLLALGVDVRGRIPVIVPSNEHSSKYLATKRQRMSHIF